MPYLKFISDKHLFKCLDSLFTVYEDCQKEMSPKEFFKNKVDPIKFNFDSSFYNISIEDYILNHEIPRQLNKTIENAIGDFNENIMGGIKGYIRGSNSGYDIKAKNNTLFAEVKNKNNTVNSSSAEATYQKLERFAKKYPRANCYFVYIIGGSSMCKQWQGKLNGKKYNHPRVFKASADRFYEILTGDKYAFKKLCDILPVATKKFLKTRRTKKSIKTNSQLVKTLKSEAVKNKNDLLSEIIKINFLKYNGFDS